MTLEEYIESIKLELTGGILELELSDEQIGQLINKSLRELQKYIDETRLITVPFSSCIDLSKIEELNNTTFITITNIYREKPIGNFTTDGEENIKSSSIDPMYAEIWATRGSAGSMTGLNNHMLNLMSYNTFMQIRNTASTDLDFKHDFKGKKLYVNISNNHPQNLTVEYIPLFRDVAEVMNPFWEDIVLRYSLALTKKTLGRLRTFAKQSSALYTLDGDTILEEGTTELKELIEQLRENNAIFVAKD